MPTRKAHARWEGTINEGKGTVDFGHGVFKGAYSFASRFEEVPGRIPKSCWPRPIRAASRRAVPGLGPGGLQGRKRRRDCPCHGKAAERRLQDHQEPHYLRGQSPRHLSSDLCAARRDSQGELPGIASSRGHPDHARGQARRQTTRGQQKRDRRVVRMVAQMDAEPFGNCSWHGEGQEACPKRVSIDVIALMNREYLRASMTRSPDDGAFRTVPGTFQFGVRLSIGHAAQDADVEAKRRDKAAEP